MIQTAIEADPRWAALVARDPGADGGFVYSVRTTGVYCRPSCAARTPRPANVAFHPDAPAAEAAGFRPCKRCRPDQPPAAERRAELVAAACRALEADSPPPLDDLAAAAGLSPHYFHRLFKAALGVTPAAYARARRAERFRVELAGAGSVTEAIYAAGFSAPSRAYDQAPLGMNPSAYRGGGQGERLRFALESCSLGTVLVAASERGVAAILLGDGPDALIEDLRARFPKAELVSADADFEATVAQVVVLIDDPQAAVALPLDVRGTAFQQRVWRALTQIPPGRTLSYAELAQRLDAPAAVRAVAGACAANALAVVIPCHRVVRADGGLAGYRWGIERKAALLRREAKG